MVLRGARGILVNVTAGMDLTIGEYDEIGEIIHELASEDANVKIGMAIDPDMNGEIRVTVVATGLGKAQAKRQSFEVIHTPVMQATGTDGAFSQSSSTGIDYGQLDAIPAVVRKGRSATVEALANSGVDRYDIPAFLRKQAD